MTCLSCLTSPSNHLLSLRCLYTCCMNLWVNRKLQEIGHIGQNKGLEPQPVLSTHDCLARFPNSKSGVEFVLVLHYPRMPLLSKARELALISQFNTATLSCPCWFRFRLIPIVALAPDPSKVSVLVSILQQKTQNDRQLTGRQRVKPSNRETQSNHCYKHS